MAVSLKHSFTSAKADDADTTLVRPSNWNAEHTLTLATAKILGRATAATGAAEEVGVGVSLVLDSGTTTLRRAALTGDVTATENSNATSITSGAATLAKLDTTGSLSQVLTAQGAGSAPIWNSVVGTTSQTGGVPTGAIIEASSNANGNYVRYADGTMLCFVNVGDTSGVTTASGSILTNAADLTWTFPSAFINGGTTQVTASVNRNDRFGGISGRVTSATAWTYRIWMSTTLAAGSTVGIRAMAVGRWF